MSLQDLIDEAKDKKLWLYCSYQELWFSPAELEKANTLGKFLWGAENFSLRNPFHHLEDLNKKIKDAQQEYVAFQTRMIKSGNIRNG